MLSTLEKHWPLISIALLIVLLASLWLWPEIAQSLSLGVILATVGMLLVFTVQRRMDENKMGLLDQSMLVRMIALDVVGILLVMCAAMIIGSLVSRVVGLSVQSALEQTAPQMAEPVGVLCGLLAALISGVGTGWLVRLAWEKLERYQLIIESSKANG